MLEAWRGRCKFRQYIANKPAKYGIEFMPWSMLGLSLQTILKFILVNSLREIMTLEMVWASCKTHDKAYWQIWL